ncbi:hypothetical protein [Nocardia veterana]|uniref:hypothetical protein n=1 Tax=Nocardia veterana TaxID=132249 RepID=UPI001B351B98|nr:hypothetical protein [Nocardia veterana]
MTGDVDYSQTQVWDLLSAPRMAPYLTAAGGDRALALSLYEWSARTVAASFEVLAHTEVLLRNSLDSALREHFQESVRGIPWFLIPLNDNVSTAVHAVRERLRQQDREHRDQIVAGLSFGFWSGLLGTKYEQLWRDCLHRAFPHSSGRRKEVSAALDGVRKFRNRLAHHDSILNIDIPFELRRVIEVAAYIDPDAASWIRDLSRGMAVYSERPVAAVDTAVVAARVAWPLYQSCQAYVCQAGRFFRPVERIAFYTESAIQPEVPLVLHRRDNVEWTAESAARLRASEDRTDRKIGAVIDAARQMGWAEGAYQVFLLTGPGHPSHRSLAKPLPHNATGRGTAFTQRQRYVSLHALETAESTDTL